MFGRARPHHARRCTPDDPRLDIVGPSYTMEKLQGKARSEERKGDERTDVMVTGVCSSGGAISTVVVRICRYRIRDGATSQAVFVLHSTPQGLTHGFGSG